MRKQKLRSRPQEQCSSAYLNGLGAKSTLAASERGTTSNYSDFSLEDADQELPFPGPLISELDWSEIETLF